MQVEFGIQFDNLKIQEDYVLIKNISYLLLMSSTPSVGLLMSSTFKSKRPSRKASVNTFYTVEKIGDNVIQPKETQYQYSLQRISTI